MTKIIWLANIVVFILFSVLLFLVNKSVENQIQSFQEKRQELLKSINESNQAIERLKSDYPQKTEKLDRVKKELEQTKIQFNPDKLRPIRGYTVNSYSVTKGNKTTTRNYIRYR